MTSGPTPISGTAAGMPLARSTIESSRKQVDYGKSDRSTGGIVDTFEASDREADGRRLSPPPARNEQSDRPNTRPAQGGDRLDLTG